MRKKKIVIAVLAVVILLVAGFGIYRLATYNTVNHADRVSSASLTELNRTVSIKAATSGIIGTNEVLLLHTLDKTLGQDSVAEFYIYQLPEGADSEDYMSLRADEAESDSSLVYMGTLTCRLVENDQSTIYDLNAIYIR